MKGLSSKSKDDLLSLACVGSIWMTGINSNGNNSSVKATTKKKTPATADAGSSKTKKVSSSKDPPPSKKLAASKVKKEAKASSSKKTPVTKVKKEAKQPKREVADSGSRKKRPAPSSSSSSSSSVPGKKAKAGAPTVVSSNMTVSQLKDEARARDPHTTGLSTKSKDWLLSHLGIGTKLVLRKGSCDAVVPDAPTSAKRIKVEQAEFSVDRGGSKDDNGDMYHGSNGDGSSHEDDFDIGIDFGYGDDDDDDDDDLSMPNDKTKEEYPTLIRVPPSKNRNEDRKLSFTVWTSHGEEDAYSQPEKEFDSSFNTLEQANERAEYVYYYDNPWGLDRDHEYLDPESDYTKEDGCRFLECSPDDSGTWTVAVVPSSVFEYIR